MPRSALDVHLQPSISPGSSQRAQTPNSVCAGASRSEAAACGVSAAAPLKPPWAERQPGPGHEIDDVAEGFRPPHVFGCDGRQAGAFLFKGGEDFDPLDGVDAEVGLDVHPQSEHFPGYAVSSLTTGSRTDSSPVGAEWEERDGREAGGPASAVFYGRGGRKGMPEGSHG